MQLPIPFNKALFLGTEVEYVRQAVKGNSLAGDGEFTLRSCRLLEERFGLKKVLLVPSGTTALDFAMDLCDIQPGDEVILPSYTFVSSANAFVRRGGRPVFVDIRPDTMDLDETKIEAAITPRTRAILPVHYAGIACEMDAINAIAAKHGLVVVEDAAQGVDAYYHGRALGSIGHLGTYSFHEAKNVVAGQGGAVCVNDERFFQRAEILHDKGTNRAQFFRGEVDKYTWVDIGSAHAMSEINAAYLCAQLEQIDFITARRREIDAYYRAHLAPLAQAGHLRLWSVPAGLESNYHIFYLFANSPAERDELLYHLRKERIAALFHFVPLHASPMGQRFGYRQGDLPLTEEYAARLLRLPFYHDLTYAEQYRVVQHIHEFFGSTPLPSDHGLPPEVKSRSRGGH